MHSSLLLSLFLAAVGINGAALSVDVSAADVKVEVEVDANVVLPYKLGWDGESLWRESALTARDESSSNAATPFKLSWEGKLTDADGNALEKRQGTCNTNDKCLREVRARRFGEQTPLSIASADCQAFFGAQRILTIVSSGMSSTTTTVSSTSTSFTTTTTELDTTVTAALSTTTTTLYTVTAQDYRKRAVSSIPSYASDCDAVAYSSACSCIGVQSTRGMTITTTVPTAVSTSTSVISFSTDTTVVITSTSATTVTNSVTSAVTVTAFFARVTEPSVPTPLQLIPNFYGVPDSLAVFSNVSSVPSQGIELYDDGHITWRQDSTMIGVVNATDNSLHFAQAAIIASNGYLPITCAIATSTFDFSCDAGNGNTVWQLFGARGSNIEIRLAPANAPPPDGTITYRDNVKLGAFFS